MYIFLNFGVIVKTKLVLSFGTRKIKREVVVSGKKSLIRGQGPFFNRRNAGDTVVDRVVHPINHLIHFRRFDILEQHFCRNLFLGS